MPTPCREAFQHHWDDQKRRVLSSPTPQDIEQEQNLRTNIHHARHSDDDANKMKPDDLGCLIRWDLAELPHPVGVGVAFESRNVEPGFYIECLELVFGFQCFAHALLAGMRDILYGTRGYWEEHAPCSKMCEFSVVHRSLLNGSFDLESVMVSRTVWRSVEFNFTDHLKELSGIP